MNFCSLSFLRLKCHLHIPGTSYQILSANVVTHISTSIIKHLLDYIEKNRPLVKGIFLRKTGEKIVDRCPCVYRVYLCSHYPQFVDKLWISSGKPYSHPQCSVRIPLFFLVLPLCTTFSFPYPLFVETCPFLPFLPFIHSFPTKLSLPEVPGSGTEYHQTIPRPLPAPVRDLPHAKKYHLPEVFCTAWMDNGAETPVDAVLPGLVLFAHLGFHEDFDEKALAEELSKNV